MSEMNHTILSENIKSLIEARGISQSDLAGAIGMSQPNLSKALNPNDKKRFTLEQVFQLSQYFGISIDELTGNEAGEKAVASPRSLLPLLTTLHKEKAIRFTTVTEKEYVYEPFYGINGYPDCNEGYKEIEYPAFYFPSYFSADDFFLDDEELYDLRTEFLMAGNETKYIKLNEILPALAQMMKLRREEAIPEEAFKMIVDGYLKKLPEK